MTRSWSEANLEVIEPEPNLNFVYCCGDSQDMMLETRVWHLSLHSKFFISFLRFYNDSNYVCVCEWNVNTGSIDIATSDVSGRQMTDRWFSLTAPSPTVRKDSRSLPPTPPVIRVKVHFRSIKILPVGLYKPLIEVRRLCRMIWRWCHRAIWSFSHWKYKLLLTEIWLHCGFESSTGKVNSKK